jgi:hypothetical protein
MTSTDRGFLAPGPGRQPESHCVRCGRVTPPGVSLCDVDNPGRIGAPSATQVHGTILAGVIAGAIGFLLLARFAVGAGGPFTATITGRASLDGAGAEVAITVVNTGESAGAATCRITRDGVPRPGDLAFRTDRILPGGSAVITRRLPAPTDGQPAWDLARITASCT